MPWIHHLLNSRYIFRMTVKHLILNGELQNVSTPTIRPTRWLRLLQATTKDSKAQSLQHWNLTRSWISSPKVWVSKHWLHSRTGRVPRTNVKGSGTNSHWPDTKTMAMVATPTQQAVLETNIRQTWPQRIQIPVTAVSIWKEWSITAVHSVNMTSMRC